MAYYTSQSLPDSSYNRAYSTNLTGDWQALRGQLLLQWHRLTEHELDFAGPDRGRVARLIERKYGISSQLIENYLHNFERTIPLQGANT